jgi:hypothetical protein
VFTALPVILNPPNTYGRPYNVTIGKLPTGAGSDGNADVHVFAATVYNIRGMPTLLALMAVYCAV